MSYPDCLSRREQQQFNEFAPDPTKRAERVSRQRAYRAEEEIEHGFKEQEHEFRNS